MINKATKSAFNSGIFTLKDETFLSNQRKAGKILKNALSLMKDNIAAGKTTKEINDIGDKAIREAGGIPTFNGYKGFPESVCISVNKVMVHGIPNDYIIKDGDVVKVDAGVTIEGAIADAAFTVAVGTISKKYEDLIKHCYDSLLGSIRFIENRIGDVTLGDLGYYIKKEAAKINANVITDYSGHGLEIGHPHFFPFVYNFGTKGEGVHIIPGMTFCIEPMFLYGDNITRVGSDEWSVFTEDVGVHFENTVFVHENKVEIIND